MKIPYVVLLVCGIVTMLSDHGLVLYASTDLSDDCCEKSEPEDNSFHMVKGIKGSVVNLTCPFRTSGNKVSWMGPPNLSSPIAVRGGVNMELNREYKWITDTQKEENILQLQNTSKADEGIFRCQVFNKSDVYFCLCLSNALNVSVLRTTTPESNDIMLKCHVNGIPDNSTFFRWEHRTLLGQHLRLFESGKTLFLPFVNQETHYCRNGIYSCNVSHGIPKANGFIFQTAQYKLYEMGKPVFMTTSKDVQFGSFQQMGTIAVNIWSDPKPTKIEMGSAETYHQLPNANFSLSMKYTILQDVIFERTVGIYGYEIKITFDIEKQNQFTNYTVRVFNEKGFSIFTIDFKSYAGMSGGEWKIYSLSSAIIVIIIGIGICFLKYRQNARRKKLFNNRIAFNITTDHAQREQNEVYDEIDERLLVDNVHGIPNSRNEVVTNSSRMQLDNAEDTSSYLQPYQEEESSASGAIIVDHFGYLMPYQRPENNRQEKSQGYEEKGPGLGNNQKSDEAFAKEVYSHQSYQELQICWQKSFHKYDTPNLNIKGLVAKQMSCTNVSNKAQMTKE